ncbi:MAG: hypothetical protein BGO28_02545 [Alphaproteobacteria bacterium 43-37]|nr:MAG: hypothetical protein BGO28_02545 [Alphaproteobacteria bacterium 43-37]
MSQFRLAVVCGGPSHERGISLNSARSISDHLAPHGIDIMPIYVDRQKQFYALSSAQLYSNTPSDFDFKLAQLAQPLTLDALRERLQGVNLVFPAIHGTFGEDGELQDLLDDWQIPYVGSSGVVCRNMYYKNLAAQKLLANGFETLKTYTFNKTDENIESRVREFFEATQCDRAIVKPVAGGSSIGVSSVDSADKAVHRIHNLFEHKIDNQALLEPFCKGREFTILVLENAGNEPVALMPTEIEISYDDGQIFDYRRKYLPTANTIYHTPPRFSHETIIRIQKEAERIFKIFGMRDFARIDGWFLEDGRLLFTDFNPISGMEQNSFLFRQSAVVGMSHASVLMFLIKRACQRNRVPFEPALKKPNTNRKPVYVLFGGRTAERQVSLMSGTNVWLKLRSSDKFYPTPYMLDKNRAVWELPYSFTLNHTVEEIFENCMIHPSVREKQNLLEADIRQRLMNYLEDTSLETSQAGHYSLDAFIKKAKANGAFVFIALHGGEGENGTLQQILSKAHVLYNGSGPVASALCMDKYLTAHAIENLADPLVKSLPKRLISKAQMSHLKDLSASQALWDNIEEEYGASSYVLKPRQDGCSAGIVQVSSAEDLQNYARFVASQVEAIPAGMFKEQGSVIEMSVGADNFILEPYIETDELIIKGQELIHHPREGWLELTVGVLESMGKYESLLPSIAIAEGAVLSLEEKFQGGTGVNITPPSESLLSKEQVMNIQKAIERIAHGLGIENYARIDIFVNCRTDEIIVIEANSLPGMTASTVIYHQALAHTPSMNPKTFLEKIIELKAGHVGDQSAAQNVVFMNNR